MKRFGLALLASLAPLAPLAMNSSALASPKAYDLKMELSLNGQQVSSPRAIVKEGEPATIIQGAGSQKQFVEVTATEGMVQEHRGILMKFVVGTIDENGERTIVARPRIIAKEGEPARITQHDTKSGTEELSLSVTAKKAFLR